MGRKIATVAAAICLLVLTLMAVASLVQVVLADTGPPAATPAGDNASNGISERSWVSVVLAVFAMFQAVLAYFVKSKLDSFMTKESCLARMSLCRHEELDPIHEQLVPLRETRAALCVRLDGIERRLDKIERGFEAFDKKIDSMAQAIAKLREWESQ
jgi:BMFP domain-containing protein YqiC